MFYGKTQILLLEDVEDDAGLVENVLRKGEIDFTTLRVDTREEFVDAVRTFQPTWSYPIMRFLNSIPQRHLKFVSGKVCKGHLFWLPARFRKSLQ